MKSLKKLFRRVRTLLWTAFSILVIGAAVIVGVGELLMPYSDRYQPRLEAWLSEEFERPVVVDSFVGEWTAFGPRLTLKGMKLMPSEKGVSAGFKGAVEAVAIESAALDIRPFNLLMPGRPFYNFRVIGADFELRHTDAGQFELSGLGVSGRDTGSQTSALKELARIGEVVLQDSSLVYQDEKYGVLLGFSEIDGSLKLDGDQLSAEIQAGFFDARSNLVYGDIEATLLLTLDQDQKMVSLDWQASAGELMLAAFQGRLPANPFLPISGWLNFELWGGWSKTGGHQISGVVDLQDARVVSESQDLQMEHVNSRLRWQSQGKGKWQLHLADFTFESAEQSWVAPRLSVARDKAADLGLWISADQLPLAVPLNLTRDIMSVYGTAWPASLPRAMDGLVNDLDLVLDASWRVVMAEGRLTRASVRNWDRWPDLQGLDAEVSLHRGWGTVQLSGEKVDANWPRLFREPIQISIPGCGLELKWGGGYQVGLTQCRLENDDLAVLGNATFSKDEGKPDIDVNAVLRRGKLDRLDPYWPESILKDGVKSWLRRGLVAGDLVSARFQIHGDMDDWPFRDGKGRFEAIAEIEQGHLDYLDGWPDAQNFQAKVRFLGPSMDLEGSIGNIGGLQAEAVSAGIADLKTPVLTVDYTARTDLPLLLGFFEETPLQELVKVDLSEFIFAGAVETSGHLVVPLGASPGELTLDGNLQMPEGYFSDPASDITLEEISGELTYDETGFTGSGLDTQFRGNPARLDVAAGAGREEKFRADLQGTFGIRDVIPRFLQEKYIQLAQFEGDSPWKASLVTAQGQDPDSARTLLTVESGLEGVSFNLPAPLDKKPSDQWPLVVRYPLSGPSLILDVELVDRATLRFDLSGQAESPRRSAIRLGGGQPALPAIGLIRVDGEPSELDLDGWLDIIIDEALDGQGMGDLVLEKGRMFSNRVLFLDRYFEDVSMAFEVVDSDVHAEFEAADINGKVRFTKGENSLGSLSAEFERLALGEPVTSGVGMESDPADLPALHLYARSFRYSGVELGETRIEAYPTATGFHFEKVDASSEHLSVLASGDWSLAEGGQRSSFEIRMASESLGDFLNTLDISSPVEGGQTLVNFSAWWSGSPAAFALSRLNGLIEFSVVDGNIADASAGGGRLLGLLSIQALPKRLSLDFRDVFDSGFSFDEATGTFQMENGTATTDDMLLKSSSANISIVGSTNLVEQQYDQLMTVRPGLGNTLPIIGVLAGGPIGAAAGLALQGLLHESLAEASQVQYTITGSWVDPVFEAVEVDRVEPNVPPGG